ncbi:hypothetical protein F4779DRAFT_603962 [Xylariaceae sp. FL0662B]|nr:hypothetical protein F4779DRAFT_603962 [Xylariaceae sp. FL0662B]
MPSSTESSARFQVSGGTKRYITSGSQPSYAMQTYLLSNKTITERYSGMARSTKPGQSRNKYYQDKAKATIQKFDDAWKDPSKN